MATRLALEYSFRTLFHRLPFSDTVTWQVHVYIQFSLVNIWNSLKYQRRKIRVNSELQDFEVKGTRNGMHHLFFMTSLMFLYCKYSECPIVIVRVQIMCKIVNRICLTTFNILFSKNGWHQISQSWGFKKDTF